jgi:LuxR family transcriptional regulator, maltose regulon positive regulatory protein
MTDDRPELSPIDDIGQSLRDAKLAIPPLRSGVVSRRSLIDAARASTSSVVAVTAPAGYGKSTLLAEWAAEEDRPVAWVSLDRFDDDPAALLWAMASAYARISASHQDLPADVVGLGVSVLGRAAPRLASAFAASPDAFVLMLDDLQELHSPACHDALSVVMAGIPPGSQLVAASRSEQPHVPRLRASREVVEYNAGDLALDTAGAQQIFADARVDLAPESVAALTERTEGWPVGLYLTALVARENPGAAFAVTGDDPYIADYLYTESLAQQPEPVQRFLRRTAVLDQLSGPLCDAILGEAGSDAQLRHLEATNSFLIPLDRRREWYRYHALYREFLLGELRRTEADSIMKLHLGAADWYESHGSPGLALEHLLHTTERERCAQLLTALILPTYSAGQMSTVERWLTDLGDTSVEQYPPLAVLAGWVAALTGHTTDTQRWAAIVDAASFDEAQLDGSASFESARAMLRAVMCAAGPERMTADAQLAVAEEPAWSPWRDTAIVLLAEAHLLAGDLGTASILFAEASALGATLGNTDTIVLGESELALLAMDDGRWTDADRHVRVALATIDDYRMQDYAVSVLGFAAAARLALHRGDLGATQHQLARAMRARPTCTFVMPWLAVRPRLHLARVHLATADSTTARHLLREIDDVFLHRPNLGALVDEMSDVRDHVAAAAPGVTGGGPPLSPAELRLLPYLQTHLTFPEIAGRVFVSHNTVRSQVGSIYRKLGVSARSEAVQQATALGLLGG